MWIKLRLKTQFFIIYFLDPRIKKKEWQKPKNFWDPGLLGSKELGEIISYQDVRFAVVSLKSESKSASSRGEFHQALGNNALHKLRPVWTQTNFHNVPLLITLPGRMSQKYPQGTYKAEVGACWTFLYAAHPLTTCANFNLL